MKNIILLTITLIACSSLSIQGQSLEEYFKIAAEANPELQAKYKEFEATLRRIPQAKALPDPTLSIGYFISPVETRVGPQLAKFSLTQMFPWFGTLKANEDAVALLADAKYQAFLNERNRLYYKIAAAYYPMYELKRWKTIEERNIEILYSYKSIALKQFEGGNGAMVDVLRIDIMLKDAITNLSILEDKKTPLLAVFNLLLNRAINEDVVMQDSLKIEEFQHYRKDSLLIDNPVLKEIDLRIKASEKMEALAMKQGLPKFGVGLDYVLVGKRSDVDMTDNGRDILMPMVTMSLPVFRSKYKAAVKETQLIQEGYQFKQNNLSNNLIANYESLDFELNKEKQLIALYDQQITESQRVLNLLYTGYANSGKAFEEVLRMQQQLLKYEKMKATSITNYHILLAKIDYITAKNL